MNAEDFTAAKHDEHLREHRLLGTRCQACGALYLPPRSLCRACHGDEMEWVELEGQGTLRAFTVIHIPLTQMSAAGYGRENPYCSGIVQLSGGPSISAQILGVDLQHPDRIEIGTPLEVEFIDRQVGESMRTSLAFRAASGKP